MTAAQADAALMRLARDVLADLVAVQQVLALSEVRGYERVVGGRAEQVRPYLSGSAVHEHVGLPAPLADQEQESLNELRHNLFIRLDPYLRRGDLHPPDLEEKDKDTSPAEMDSHVRSLDGAFAKARPVTKPLVVYRGFHARLPAKGEMFEDKSFASTSTDLGHASSFAWNEAGTRRMPLARIVIPAGKRVISQANLGIKRYNEAAGDKWDSDAGAGFDPSGEEEILLNRNSRFRVAGSHRESSSYRLPDADGKLREHKQWHHVVDLELL